jgi:hypothetical protein
MHVGWLEFASGKRKRKKTLHTRKPAAESRVHSAGTGTNTNGTSIARIVQATRHGHGVSMFLATALPVVAQLIAHNGPRDSRSLWLPANRAQDCLTDDAVH